MSNHNAAISAAQNRAWIYIRKTRTPDPYLDSLEKKLRSFAASQNLTVAGISIDFNQRRGGHGVSQMLREANERTFDILVVNSFDQLSDSQLSVFDIMACLDKKGIKACAPGGGFINYAKMKSDYDMERYMDGLEERRMARERMDCYMGDCEPEDYDGDDYGNKYDTNGWEKGKCPKECRRVW